MMRSNSTLSKKIPNPIDGTNTTDKMRSVFQCCEALDMVATGLDFLKKPCTPATNDGAASDLLMCPPGSSDRSNRAGRKGTTPRNQLPYFGQHIHTHTHTLRHTHTYTYTLTHTHIHTHTHTQIKNWKLPKTCRF